MDPNAQVAIDAAAATPRKFIRTYASDVEAVKRGASPDLAPYTPSAARKNEEQDQITGASPPRAGLPALARETEPELEPEFEKTSPTAAGEIPPGALGAVYDRDRRAAAARANAAAIEPPAYHAGEAEREAALARLRARAHELGLPVDGEARQAPVEPVREPTQDQSASPLHTYSEDVSKRIDATGISRAAILAAEADARPAPPRQAPPAPRRGRLQIIIGAALLLVGSVGAYVAYVRYVSHTAPVVIAPVAPAPIFVDEREAVSGTGPALVLAVSQAVGRPLASGEARLLYDASTSAESLFNQLELPVPGILSRNIVATGSMAGVVSASGGQSPFFILSVASYGDTFSGMLAWEPTMLRSLAPLFPAYTEIPTSGAASSTASTTAPALANVVAPPPQDQGFIDEVVDNHDARVYRDGYGRSVVIYGYWDQTTLVIARDEAAFTAILGRLATSRTQ